VNPVVDWLRRYRRLLGAAFLLTIAGLFMWRVRAVLTPFVLAGVLAYLLNPLLKLLLKRGFSRVAALIFIYLVVFLSVAVAVGFLIPRVIIELGRLAEFLPGLFAQLQQMVLDFQEQYTQVQMPQAVRQAIDDAVLSIQSQALGLIGRTAQSILGVFSAFFGLIIAPILSFYLLKDVHGLRLGVQRLIPAADRESTFKLLGDVDKVLSGFVRGQLTVALLVGSLVAVALTFLQIRFAVILGIFAGITNIIPYFGPILGAIPILAVAATMSYMDVLRALIAVVVIQQLESQVISPRVIGRSVGLHPLAVVFALLVGLELYGILGMIIAVPIAGIIRVLVDVWVDGRASGEAAAHVAQAAHAAQGGEESDNDDRPEPEEPEGKAKTPQPPPGPQPS